MCALEGCGSFHEARFSICKYVNEALFPCHSTINPHLLSPELFKSVVAQSIKQLCLINEATKEPGDVRLSKYSKMNGGSKSSPLMD